VSTLIRIKRLVMRNRIVFTEKADLEMQRDHISEEMVREATGAPGLFKKLFALRLPAAVIGSIFTS